MCQGIEQLAGPARRVTIAGIDLVEVATRLRP